MRKITKRSAAIATAVVVAVGGAGAAFAAWTLNSSVETTGTAGTALPLEVKEPKIVGELVPGTVNSVSFTAKNPNKFPVKISGISYTLVSATNGIGGAPCAAGNLQQIPGATLPSDLTLAKAGDGDGDSKTFVYANSIRLKVNPDDACQGSKFTFKVNLTVASDA